MSQPFSVAEAFTGMQGKLVLLDKTIEGFEEILDGKKDQYPEQAFYMIGDASEIEAKALKMAKETK